jgi:hypothetical protein
MVTNTLHGGQTDMSRHILNNVIVLFSNLCSPDNYGRYGVLVEVRDTYQLKPFTTSRRGQGIGKETATIIRCALRKQDIKEEYRTIRRGDIITLEVSADTYILKGKEYIYPSIINIYPLKINNN